MGTVHGRRNVNVMTGGVEMNAMSQSVRVSVSQCALATVNVLLQVFANAHLAGVVLPVTHRFATASLQVRGPAATEACVRTRTHADAQQGTQAWIARIQFVRAAALMPGSVLRQTHANAHKGGVEMVAARLFAGVLLPRVVPARSMGDARAQRNVPATSVLVVHIALFPCATARLDRHSVGGMGSAVHQTSARAWRVFRVNSAAMLCATERQMVRGRVLGMGIARNSISANALKDGEDKSVPHQRAMGSA